jgi:hypothetical protein
VRRGTIAQVTSRPAEAQHLSEALHLTLPGRSAAGADEAAAQESRFSVLPSALVLVVVLVVRRVPAPVVNVVDVVTVRDRHMAAALAMNVAMTFMHVVAAGGLAFVIVIVVPPMKMTVMHIVDVIAVRDGDMAAALAMCVVVAGVFLVSRLHHRFSLYPTGIWSHASASARPYTAAEKNGAVSEHA